MVKRIIDLRLAEKREWPQAVLLKLRSDVEPLPEAAPGQFLQVRVDQSPATYLRRPVSIHYIDQERRELWLLVRKVGAGTRTMAQWPLQTRVNVIFPLGHPYTLPQSSSPERCLLVGGGIGIAPLLYLGKTLQEQGHQPVFLLGGRSAEDLIQLNEFEQYGELCLCTEDGSAGTKGLVTDHPVLQGPLTDRIYCCGPKPMMVAMGRYARQKGIWCEVSLENTMACGIGACLCCVEDTVEGHRCVCQEGPVFNINQLKWQI